MMDAKVCIDDNSFGEGGLLSPRLVELSLSMQRFASLKAKQLNTAIATK